MDAKMWWRIPEQYLLFRRTMLNKTHTCIPAWATTHLGSIPSQLRVPA
jgi:hypothetical protein